MANYAVTDYSTGEKDSVEEATAALEAYLETIDTTKTIYAMGVVALGRDRQKCVGYVLHIA